MHHPINAFRYGLAPTYWCGSIACFAHTKAVLTDTVTQSRRMIYIILGAQYLLTC